MGKCKYSITVNGNAMEFNSDEELNSFISNNYHRLKSGNDNIKFSKDFDPKEETLGKIQKAIAESTNITQVYDDDGIKQLHVGKGYTGVTRKIDTIRNVNNRRLTKEFIPENYVKNQLPVYVANLKQDPRYASLADPVIEKLATDQILGQLRNWKMLGTMGTDIHAMMQAFFEEGISDPQQMLDKIKKPFSLETMTKYVNILKEIKNRILSDTNDPNAHILCEVKIHDPNSKVAGILDLVAIDKDGNAIIYDLKTSYKALYDWNRSKVNKMYYQMAMYKQLLGTIGVNTKGIRIIPLELLDVDYDSNLVSDLKLDPNEDVGLALSASPYISQAAKEIIPTSINSLLDVHVESAKIKSQLNDAFGYEVKAAHVYGLDSFEQNAVKTADNGDKYFVNTITKKQVVLSGDPEKDKETIETYLTDKATAKNETVLSTKNAIASKIKNPALDVFNILGDKKKSLTKIRYTEQIFTPYLDGSWEILESPDLDALGVLGFRNKFTSALDFVSITANDLNSKVKLSKGTTILGNHVPDEALRQDRKIYAATATNMEALKIAMFLNENISKFTGSDAESSINRIRITNLDFKQTEGVNLEDLIYNYGKLCKYTNTESVLNKMKRSNPFDLLISKINNIVESDTIPQTLRSRIENMQAELNPDEDGKRLQELKDLYIQFSRENNITPDTVRNFTRPEEQLMALLADSILYYENIHVRYEENMKEYSLNNSSMLSTPDNIASKNVQAENKLVKTAMSNIVMRHVTFKENTRDSYEKLFDVTGISKMSRNIIGNHVDAYKNLIIRDKDGKVSPELRLKDPDNMQNDLKPGERTFLKNYLTELNKIRYDINDHEAILDAKETGEWFNIPLMKVTSSSRFMNSDYKKAWKDYYDDVLDYYKLFTEDKEEAARVAHDMLEMFNPFNSSVNTREAMLSKHPVSDFETNLEVVLDTFAMAHVRKQEYDKVLPTIQALRMVTKYYHAGLLDKDINYTLDFMKNFVKTAVYNEKLIEPHMQKWAKVAAVVRNVTSEGMLGLNVLSGARQFLQGQWAIMSRLYARTYGKDMFTKEEYGKAVSYLVSDAPDFINNVTKIEELNHVYRMSGMDVNALVDRMKASKTGLASFNSRYMFWFNSAPDYFHRMSMFVAQMIHDGTFNAHEMTNGKLIYDWKKDARFKEYSSGNTNSPLYKEQKGLYLAMLTDFNNQGITNEGRPLKEGDALPYAYTVAQKESYKSFADNVHGSYDHDTKIMFQHTMFGMMFGQFRTWLIAKKDQWALKGGTYVQGNYEHMEDENGRKLYLTMAEDGTRTIGTEETDAPLYDWKGKWQEGILISLGRVFNEVEWGKMNFGKAVDLVKNNGEIASNLKMMSHDLALVIGMALIYGLIDWKDLNKNSPGTAELLKTITGSANDLYVGNNIAALANPKSFLPSFGYIDQTTQQVFHVLTGQQSIGKALASQFGVLSPILR